MGKIAIVFSGQGSQYTGMGKELYETSACARAVFDMADTIRPGTKEQCFTALKEELARTINTQPCLFCVDLAAAESLKEYGVQADMIAGFSLGEIPALAFGGMLTQAQAFELVCKRAEYMEDCAQKTKGGMAAILGLPDETVEKICKDAGVYPANYNCEKQLVIAGESDALDNAIEKVKAAGGKAIKMPVGGAFHSPFMNDAAQKLESYLNSIEIKTPGIAVYSNVTARAYADKSLIPMQIKSPVMWRKTIENMIEAGADTFIEAGPGKTLCGLIKKIAHDVKVYNVENKDSLFKALEGLKNA